MSALLALLAGAGAGAYGFRTARRLRPARRYLVGALLGTLGAVVVSVLTGGCAYSPEVDAAQHILGIAVAGGIGLAVASGTSVVLASAKGGRDAGSIGSDIRTGTYRLGWWWPWALLLPTIVILVVFLYVPAVQTFTLSTKLVRLGAPRQIEVCLANFSELLTPNPWILVILPLIAVGVMWGLGLWKRRASLGSMSLTAATALQPFGIVVLLLALYYMFNGGPRGYRGIYVNTLVVSAGTVAGGMILGLAVAYLAFQKVRGMTVYRTLLIWPYAVSPPVAGILFFMMFDPTAGIIQHLFELVGVTFPNYREDVFLARFAVIAASTWKILGYNVLFYLAGLQNVPGDQIEASVLDGASAWQRFRYVVTPSLAPITFFLLITNLTYAFFEVYGTIDYLTRGAPAGKTSVAIYEIIRVGVENRDIGRGAAQSVLLFLAVIGLTVWQFKQSESRITYGGGG
ncbi:MAG: sugar ABC transporter permease [Acidimicrobiia bacterium]|nr:sugar ABC transporter permease [Acidimicrobiia bacterium]